MQFGQTMFTGTVNGLSTDPISLTSAASVNQSYVTSSATNGDTRNTYLKTTFTAAGSGETLRAYTILATGAGAVAPGGTVNGAHVSLDINGTATVSGAGNAFRATLGGTSTNPGGTLAAIQADSNFATGGTWTNAAFIRFTNSGTGTVANLFNVPKAMVAAGVLAASSHVIKIVADDGTPYWILANSAAS
jgi:hypothetical protein